MAKNKDFSVESWRKRREWFETFKGCDVCEENPVAAMFTRSILVCRHGMVGHDCAKEPWRKRQPRWLCKRHLKMAQKKGREVMWDGRKVEAKNQ